MFCVSVIVRDPPPVHSLWTNMSTWMQMGYSVPFHIIPALPTAPLHCQYTYIYSVFTRSRVATVGIKASESTPNNTNVVTIRMYVQQVYLYTTTRGHYQDHTLPLPSLQVGMTVLLCQLCRQRVLVRPYPLVLFARREPIQPIRVHQQRLYRLHPTLNDESANERDWTIRLCLQAYLVKVSACRLGECAKVTPIVRLQ